MCVEKKVLRESWDENVYFFAIDIISRYIPIYNVILETVFKKSDKTSDTDNCYILKWFKKKIQLEKSINLSKVLFWFVTGK